MKIAYAVIALIILALLVMIALPAFTANAWKTRASEEITSMLDHTNQNMESTVEFLGIAEPTDSDYDAEIERLKSSAEKVDETIASVSDLQPSGLDLLGQYSESEGLKEAIVTTLGDIKEKYNQQVEVLEQDKAQGLTESSANRYGEVSEELSAAFDRLSGLIDQL